MIPVLRFSIAFILLTILVVSGVLGYMIIEDWTIGESLYMTIITITTVGFAEVHPLSDTGRHFTVIFLIFSVAILGYSVTTLITYIFEGQIVTIFKERRMNRRIKRLRDHYIICGCGTVGREVALDFKNANVKFVIVELNPENTDLAKDETILFMKGDAEDDEVLREASIDRAKGLIAALHDDEENVFVVLTARQLNPSLTIVAKASEERTIRKLLKAGADRVVSPKQIAGHRMASIILRPSVMSFLDVVVGKGDVLMQIEEVRIEENSPLINRNLREVGIGQQTGAIIVGINGPNGETRVNPTAEANLSSVLINSEDTLIALGSEDQLNSLKEFVKYGPKD